jgi:23S rRNA (uracil1939-C5)-methyltransferase
VNAAAGAEVRFVVRDLDSDGAGVGAVAKPGELEVHVPGSLPGEEISARIDSVSTHRPVAWATLRAIHHPSVERVAPACPAHGRCGGCVLQHYGVDAQARWKEARLRHDVAQDPALAGIPVSAMVTSPRALGYRNNSKLVAGRDLAGRLVLGAYAPRTHQVVDLAGCAITEPALEQTATALVDVLRSHEVQPYDEARLTGVLRYVVLRANATGQVLVTLVTSGDPFPSGVLVAQALVARTPNVTGVVQNINPDRGNAIFGSVERTLHGDTTIEDRIGTVRLRISSRAFFQANRDVAHAAYQAIAAAISPRRTERVVDAYAGVGGIALTLAPGARCVIGIEEHAGAVRDADASATLNQITNARFVAGDVSAHLGAIGRADLVVLNPPRKGCAREVLHQVARLRPRAIAYLSCAPETLLRDLAILATLDYRTREITPFDMLPHTSHVEALALLVAG